MGSGDDPRLAILPALAYTTGLPLRAVRRYAVRYFPSYHGRIQPIGLGADEAKILPAWPLRGRGVVRAIPTVYERIRGPICALPNTLAPRPRDILRQT
jgi:hypothetical protein